MFKKLVVPVQVAFFLLFVNSSVAQKISIDERGVETTDYGKVVSYYDPFTDHLTIGTHNELMVELNKDIVLIMSPFFNRSQECYQLECGSFIIVISSEDTSIIEFLDFTEEIYSQEKFPVLFDDDRDELTVRILNENYEIKSDLKDFVSSMLAIEFSLDQLDKLIESETARIRIDRTVFSFGEEVKSTFNEIRQVLNERRSVKQGESQQDSAPYEIKWEGNIERDPTVQPLPQNTANSKGVISVRFQVKPDGTVGLIIPLKKMDAELEKEVQKTLRSWEFSKLPSGVPQQVQWGTITFRFVF